MQQANAETAMPSDPVADWPLGQLGREAARLMAAAVPIAERRDLAAQQARTLKASWATVLRLRREAMAGILPGTVPARKPALTAPDAAAALGLTFALANALGTLRRAHETADRHVAIELLDETLAAITTAIRVRDAVAYPERS